MSSGIIIIDDILQNTELLYEICIAEGLLDVYCFDDPVLAIQEIISLGRPDLIITDIRMPVMSGTDVLNRLEYYFGEKLNAILITGGTFEKKLITYPVLTKGSDFFTNFTEFLKRFKINQN